MSKRPSPYYMLYTHDAEFGWSPQFGGWSRQIVADEQRDSYRRQKAKIERFDHCPSHAEVMEHTRAMNEPTVEGK